MNLFISPAAIIWSINELYGTLMTGSKYLLILSTHALVRGATLPAATKTYKGMSHGSTL